MDSLSQFQAYILKHISSLSEKIVKLAIERMDIYIPPHEEEQAIQMYVEFLQFLCDSIFCKEYSVPLDLVAWSKQNAENAASIGMNISEIIVRYPPTREVFIEVMTAFQKQFQLSIDDYSSILIRINTMLDVSINETLFAFERKRVEIEQKTQKEMAELSAPIVPLQKGIAVLPLIGSIDEYRIHHLFEKVVPAISEMELNHLIVDFSGIAKIDFAIAHHLFQVECVLRLLGINTIITGIQPHLSRTVVEGGIDLSSIVTFSTVQRALENLQ